MHENGRTVSKDDLIPVLPENETTQDSHCLFSIAHDSMYFHGFSPDQLYKKPVRALSLFDGLSVGRFCLDKLKIVVHSYFSSEIDDDALKLQRYNFGDKVIPLGCVKQITTDVLRSLACIDLLLAAPPCQDFSLANPKRLNFSGENGKLFDEFTRILKDLCKINEERGTKLYFLCENVQKMKKKTRDFISSALGCEPYVHNAAAYGYMSRGRLFWHNFPKENSDLSLGSGQLGDILSCSRTPNVKILPTLTTAQHSQLTGKNSKKLPVLDGGEPTTLLTVEQERAFGLPTSFTDGADLSVARRKKLLGRAWCANTIATILNPLRGIFETLD